MSPFQVEGDGGFITEPVDDDPVPQTLQFAEGRIGPGIRGRKGIKNGLEVLIGQCRHEVRAAVTQKERPLSPGEDQCRLGPLRFSEDPAFEKLAKGLRCRNRRQAGNGPLEAAGQGDIQD
ncbi:hypothetical protein ACTVH1_18910 [Gluconobacter cerinus]